MKKFAKFLSAAVVAAMCLVGFASCSKDGDKTYKIGMSGPLTGGAALYGTAVKNAAQMAVGEINAAGGLNGVKFELIALDDANDATKVATNYAELMKRGVQVTLGCVTTQPALEFKALAEEDNLFYLTPSASNDDVPNGTNGYQMCFADGNQGAVAAQYVNENYKNQTIGVLYKSDEAYSSGIFTQFKENLDPSVKMIETSFLESTSSDFSVQIDKLKDCKFIFLPIYYTPAAVFMTQAKDTIAKDAVYYGCDGLDGIDSAEGFDINTIPQEVSMLSHFNSKATDGKAKEFIDKYTTKYGTETLNQFGASAYDCVYAIYEAMKAAGSKVNVDMSASELCDVLKAQFNGGFTFSGATGTNIKWDAKGYVQKSAIKYVVKAASK